MGTNYYAEMKQPCPTCGHGGERIHIGKSSAGWPFLFQMHKDPDLRDWSTWKTWLMSTGGRIFNEYEDLVSIQELEELVVTKRRFATERYVLFSGIARTKEGDQIDYREFS